jgi:hypothetical protein
LNLLDQIPGLKDAVAAEQYARDLAFAEVPEDVAGVAVVPLNWLRFTRLALAGSPFVCGGAVTPREIAATLWLLSPSYTNGHDGGASVLASRLRRWLFLRRLRRVSYLQLCAALDEYFRAALADAPGGSGTPGDTPSYYSALASQVDLFAHEYGWPAAAIVRLPFKQLWQLLRCIQARHGQRTFFNPSDRVRGDWLRSLNSGNTTN